MSLFRQNSFDKGAKAALQKKSDAILLYARTKTEKPISLKVHV